MSEDRPSPNEVVIVRRRGGGHGDGHHGGAWKIAFADFMTALMCFFLVMWLINSTDKKTVAQIASYFNPLKLNDKKPSQKGVYDPGPPANPHNEKIEKTEDKNAKDAKGEQPAGQNGGEQREGQLPAQNAGDEGPRDQDDQGMLRDPYAALARIAEPETTLDALRMTPNVPRDAGGPADPFESPQKSNPVSAGSKAMQGVADIPRQKGGNEAEKAGADPDPEQMASGSDIEGAQSPSGKLRREIMAALSDIEPGSKPDIEVADEKTAILISLTDEFDFGMFKVGSASPTRNSSW